MSFINHPSIFGLFFANFFIIPVVPVDLPLAFNILFHNKLNNFTFVVFLAAHAAYLQLQQLYKFVPAVKDSFVLYFVTNFLPVNILYSNCVKALIHISTHYLVVMEFE